MRANELAGGEFLLKVTIDPLEIVGSEQSFGFAACGDAREFGAHYLADVKPATNRLRILRISNGNTTIAAESDIQGFSVSDLEPFELELVGSRTGNSITLDLTVRKDGQSHTVSGTDNNSLDGAYFGLRCRNQGTNYECHFDDYELRPLHTLTITTTPSLLAPIGEPFLYDANTDSSATFQSEGALPVWLSLTTAGVLSGTPSAGDTGAQTIALLATSSNGAIARQEFLIAVLVPNDAVISEFVADNNNSLEDEEGDSPDWIEVMNPTSTAIDLTGWHLTDDPADPALWMFPSGTILPPLGTLIVFASDKNLVGHANFKLSASSGYLALVRPDGSMASEFIDYPSQEEDISYGVYGDYVDVGYFTEPTPDAPNIATAFDGFTSDTQFSVARGFFDAAFSVDVISATSGATIVTTTDGTVPTLTNGTASPSPATISITGTTVLRAAAFSEGLVPTNADTQTYFFLDDIRAQDSSHALANGWPSSSINGQVFDYGMDPEIVDPLSDAEFEEAMTDIPSISFVTDLDNFNDPLTGFWVNAENRGRAWERPVSVELINPDASEGFQIDAGVRLRGGFSRQGSNPKHSFRLVFRSEYGEGKLNFPLFGDEGTDSFDAVDLRTSQGRSWHFSDTADATFNRDVFGRSIQREMGQPYSRSRHYHLYINGQYFGLYQSQERMDADFAASYFGGNDDDYDVLKTRTRPHRVETVDGSPDAWIRLFDAAVAGFASDSQYFAVQGLTASGDPDPTGDNLIDIENLVDYMTAIFYTAQSDGPVNLSANVPKNFFAMRARDGSFGFRFFVHDNEDSLSSSNANVTVDNDTGDRLTYFNPKWLHQRFSVNALYRQRFGDRAQRHFFNDGALTTAVSQAIFSSSSDVIENAVIGESARWGDAKRSNPYDQADWQNAISDKLSSFIPNRGNTVLNQLRNINLYPDIDAPSFTQHGGQVPIGFPLCINTTEGEIFYTLDGSDPSGPNGILFDSSLTTDVLLPINSSGWNYLVTATPLSDSEVTVGDGSYGIGDWKHPNFNDSVWLTGEAPLGYGGVGSPNWTTQISDGGTVPRNRTTYLRKTFNVVGASNYSDLRIDIRRDDGAIVYLNGREIARSNMPAGNVAYADFAASNASNTAETSYFSEVYTLASGDLLEGSNTLAVEIHQGSAISSDLVIDVGIIGNNSNNSAIAITTNTTVKARALSDSEWSALTEASFLTSTLATASNLIISELYYNPPGSSNDTEYIELMNTSLTETIHLDGLSFADGITFAFPEGVTLAPGERVLIVGNKDAFEEAFGTGLRIIGEFEGGLSNGGEQLVISGILGFEYDDKLPWSELADGEGRSLVFTGGDPADPESWRASAFAGGSPGTSDSTTFGGGDFESYAFGGFGQSYLPSVGFSFPRNLAASDVEYTLEVSDDLENWGPAVGWVLVSEELLQGDFISMIWSPSLLLDREFVRMRAEFSQ